MGGLSIFHFWLVAKNMTTYEHFRHKYSSTGNPYSRGLRHNFGEVWCSGVPPRWEPLWAKQHAEDEAAAMNERMAVSAAASGDGENGGNSSSMLNYNGSVPPSIEGDSPRSPTFCIENGEGGGDDGGHFNGGGINGNSNTELSTTSLESAAAAAAAVEGGDIEQGFDVKRSSSSSRGNGEVQLSVIDKLPPPPPSPSPQQQLQQRDGAVLTPRAAAATNDGLSMAALELLQSPRPAAV